MVRKNDDMGGRRSYGIEGRKRNKLIGMKGIRKEIAGGRGRDRDKWMEKGGGNGISTPTGFPFVLILLLRAFIKLWVLLFQSQNILSGSRDHCSTPGGGGDVAGQSIPVQT